MIKIIGGSGFVGSSLINLLDSTNCRNLDKNQSLLYPKITSIGDIRNIDEIKIDKDCSFVIL